VSDYHLSVYMCMLVTLQKRVNRSWTYLGMNSCGPKEPYIRYLVQIPQE